ncbi:CYTH domain-containing protein [Candidatus Woesearchaeota archaeon]|nr:CYTH domain-containing protein [Candidatus Woesearchaeota archaeon]
MLEVELRSFITHEQYSSLISFFKKSAEPKGEDTQITFYFDGPQDLRIQKNNTHSKVWLKKGELHDEAREEIEIKCAREDFELLEQLFLSLGYNIQIKWYRARNTFLWNGITVTVDHTKGYGHILELEILCTPEDKETALELLRKKFSELGIQVTPKEQFDAAYQNYKANWKTLVEDK